MPSALLDGTSFADMTLMRGVKHALSDEDKQILYTLARRISAIRPHQDRLKQWCDRADEALLRRGPSPSWRR
jgi:hypothetical protein